MPHLTLGPFAVHRDGTLEPRAAERLPAMRFAWRGRRCEAGLSAGSLRLAAIAARVPSTAEAGADRARALATVAVMQGELPQGWQLKLLPDHRIRIETEAPFPDPPTATSLIACMVRFALAIDPYLDRLDGAGASGTWNTCPG
jgi:hypothetical protein